MSHGSRDNPDPSLILTTTRDRVSSRKITDPTNDEPLDVAHQAGVKKSIGTVLGLIDQVEVLARALPKSVPKAPKDGEIWRVLNKVKGQDTGPGKVLSTFVRRMDLLFGSGARDANGRIKLQRGSSGILLVVQYLRSINWKTDGIPALAPATAKLNQLIEELERTIKPPSANTPPPALPTGSKRSAGDALSDNESFFPPTKIRSILSLTPLLARNGSVTLEESDESEGEDEPSPTPSTSHRSQCIAAKQKPIVVDSGSESKSGSDSSPASPKLDPSGKKNSRATRATKNGDRIRGTKRLGKTSGSDPTALGADGMLADIEVQPLTPATESKSDPTADIKQFFGDPFTAPGRGNVPKLHRKCKTCGLTFDLRDTLISDATTNRRHMAKHANLYRKWAKKHGFESKLEEDIKSRKKALADAEEEKAKLHQQTLEPHLREKPDRVALEWLIATDQPIDALNHPKFKEMIDVASRAPDGVKIPGRKATRDEIMNMFQKQMENLRVRINCRYLGCVLSGDVDVYGVEADPAPRYASMTRPSRSPQVLSEQSRSRHVGTVLAQFGIGRPTPPPSRLNVVIDVCLISLLSIRSTTPHSLQAEGRCKSFFMHEDYFIGQRTARREPKPCRDHAVKELRKSSTGRARHPWHGTRGTAAPDPCTRAFCSPRARCASNFANIEPYILGAYPEREEPLPSGPLLHDRPVVDRQIRIHDFHLNVGCFGSHGIRYPDLIDHSLFSTMTQIPRGPLGSLTVHHDSDPVWEPRLPSKWRLPRFDMTETSYSEWLKKGAFADEDYGLVGPRHALAIPFSAFFEHGWSAGVTWHSGISVKFKLVTGSSSTEANEALTGGHGPKCYCKEEALNKVHEDGGGSGYSLQRWQHRAESALEADRALRQWERPTWLQA
ncbi:hypothetical protein DFH06DRAFT_1130673 [Mycena polygramma]|nr:hypothetical protein DFH06DRAFT_1130673 [Mycena polygramma]